MREFNAVQWHVADCEKVWRKSDQGKALRWMLQNIARVHQCKLIEERQGSTTQSTAHLQQTSAVQRQDVERQPDSAGNPRRRAQELRITEAEAVATTPLEQVQAMSQISFRPDYEFHEDVADLQTPRACMVGELKSPKTLGLVAPGTTATDRVEAVQTTIENINELDSLPDQEYGALLQVVAYMIRFKVPVGMLTDGSIFILLYLRRKRSMPGEFSAPDKWLLKYHVFQESMLRDVSEGLEATAVIRIVEALGFAKKIASDPEQRPFWAESAVGQRNESDRNNQDPSASDHGALNRDASAGGSTSQANQSRCDIQLVPYCLHAGGALPS
jgi:hypothetical protein